MGVVLDFRFEIEREIGKLNLIEYLKLSSPEIEKIVRRVKISVIQVEKNEGKSEESYLKKLDQSEIEEVELIKNNIINAEDYSKKNDLTIYGWTCLQCQNLIFKCFTQNDSCPLCGNKNLNLIKRKIR